MTKPKKLFLSILLCLIFPIAEAQQVIINEVMSMNTNTLADFDGDYSDWVEIYNNGTTSVNLMGYHLTDKKSKLTKWKFPNITIAPHQYLVVWASSKDVVYSNGEIHTNFSISAEGEILYLVAPDGVTILDQSVNRPLPPNISMGRKSGNYIDWALFNDATPGSTNSVNSYSGITNSPIFSTNGGFYENQITLNLSTSDGLELIYYTLDGSLPNSNSTLYTNSILINSTTVVRAISMRNGFISGPVITNTYFFEDDVNLNVISLVTSSSNLWGTDGIYTNYNSGNEKPIHIEYYENNGTPGFSLDAGVKIHAPDSRSQKSLRLYVRSGYGTNRIDYKLFDEKTINSFKVLILRNGGNDGAEIKKTHIRDAYTHKIYHNLNPNNAISAYRPVHVYINGGYWGIYNLRERQDENYLEDNFGFKNDEVDFLEYDYAEPQCKKTISGDWTDFENLKTFVLENDLSLSANYEVMKSWIDIENFIDYQITEILVGNQDWCNNNIKFWRPKAAGGKWKWVLWDTEYALGTYKAYPVGKPEFDFFAMAMSWGGWGNDDYTWMFRKLMANSEFKWLFVSRSLDLLNTGYNEDYTINLFNTLADAITPDMHKQFKKWGSDFPTWNNDLDYTRTYIKQRPNYYKLHMAQKLGFSSVTHDLTVDVSDTQMGWIQINTIPIKEETPGIDEKIPYPWIGKYFDDIPVKVKAFANKGYRFVKWQGVNNSSSAEIEVQFSNNASVTAIFELAATSLNASNAGIDLNIFPNPATDYLNVQVGKQLHQGDVLKIVNTMGHALYYEDVNKMSSSSFKIDLRNFTPGIYILTLQLESGEFTSRKFVVK